jgi:hypothetical protein
MFKADESIQYHNKVDSAVIRNFVIHIKHVKSTDVSGALKIRDTLAWLITIIRDRVLHWD